MSPDNEAPRPAFLRPADELLESLEVARERGLSAGMVSRRLEETGPNRLRKSERKPWWRVALDQFKSLVVILLLVAAAIAAAFGQMVEAVAIAAALVINAVIGFVTEWKALQSMEALKRMGQMSARVRRDGEERKVPSSELVPGDMVLLGEGEMVPADLRLVEVENLQCNEAALTGESVPVSKTTDRLEDPEIPLAERENMAFSGTAVSRGAAEGVVVATGMDTEIGRISAMVEEAEEEATPLERRLEGLGKRLIYLVIVVGVGVAVSGIVAGKDLLIMVETAIVLAIAAVPEGLPIVATVALGRGMWRMARRNALVKRLAAVETLGATTVIFSDKTGTLTENRMVLRRVALAIGDAQISRHNGDARFRLDDEDVDPQEQDDLHRALRAGVLCSNAELEGGDGPSGDPTEVALVEAGAWAGLDRPDLLDELPEEREESFDTETKKMATFHRVQGGFLVAVKGAPEPVLDVCTRVLEDGEEKEFDDAARDAWLERNESLAEDGLRVLAVAEKRAERADEAPYQGLTLLGLVGLYDPPRESVKEAIRACREAGIRVVMVTGDQPATAANIARAIGIVGEEEETTTMRGRDLGDLDEDHSERAERVWQTAVFARVSPEQKLSLIRVYQDRGEVVGMTGDGVNDAPALKKADIGIAMGRRGTEVARETSDIVLKDDAFETIVMAIDQGRTIFENIRRFIVFLLSGNLGQIVGVSAAALVNAPLPLLPLQILFLNLLLDVFPALAIGVSRGSADIMRQPPRDPAEPILTRGHWLGIAGFGLLMTTALLGVFGWALLVMEVDTTRAVTMAFLTYGLARLWHVFNMRTPDSPMLRNDLVTNPWVWGAIVLCAALLAVAVYVPPLAALLQVVPPTPAEWIVILTGSLVPLALGQLALAVLRRR
ncbi:MAG: cation-transporting P-type ATPase [Thioalkalivibrio sp.]|nr:cation-transporting P-type ATPase [Thioalkalivibrio sp.]